MARKSTEDLVRIHVWIRRDDHEAIQAMYSTTVGVSKMIRTLIAAHVKEVRSRTSQKSPKPKIEDIDFEQS